MPNIYLIKHISFYLVKIIAKFKKIIVKSSIYYDDLSFVSCDWCVIDPPYSYLPEAIHSRSGIHSFNNLLSSWLVLLSILMILDFWFLIFSSNDWILIDENKWKYTLLYLLKIWPNLKRKYNILIINSIKFSIIIIIVEHKHWFFRLHHNLINLQFRNIMRNYYSFQLLLLN